VLTGSELPAPEAAAAAARMEVLAEDLRAAGYPGTVGQARADLYLRLLDGTLDGLTQGQILATMLRLGPIASADSDPDAHVARGSRVTKPRSAMCASSPRRPSGPFHPTSPSGLTSAETGTSRPRSYGIEVRVRLPPCWDSTSIPRSYPAGDPSAPRSPGTSSPPNTTPNGRITIVDTQAYLLHGDLTRRRPSRPGARGDCAGGIVEIAVPVPMLDEFPRWPPTTPSGHGSCMGSPPF